MSWVPTKAVVSKLKRAGWKLEPSRASFLVLWVAVGRKEAWRGQGGSVGTLHYGRLETRTVYAGHYQWEKGRVSHMLSPQKKID